MRKTERIIRNKNTCIPEKYKKIDATETDILNRLQRCAKKWMKIRVKRIGYYCFGVCWLYCKQKLNL